MPRWAIAILVGFVLAAVLLLFFFLPAHRRLRVAEFVKVDLQLDCCRKGFVRAECKEALDELVSLAPGDSLARMQVSACPVAREMDPSLPHPPEERLCGYLTSFEDRRAAARELGTKLSAVAAAKGCPPEGRDAALGAAQSDFERVCGADFCLGLLAAAPDDPKARRLAQAHAGELLVRLGGATGIGDETQRAILSAAYPGEWQSLAAILRDDGARRADLAPYLDVESPQLTAVRVLRKLGSPAGARAHLVLHARRQEPMTPAEETRACEASSCGFLAAFSSGELGLEEPARAAACRPRLAACHLELEEADAGVTLPFERSDGGEWVYGGKTLMDPERKDPIAAMGRCLGLVLGCYQPALRPMDQCWSRTEHCQTAQPWNEPIPCCPDACFAQYKAQRAAGRTERDAFTAVARDRSCFPGLR